MNQPNIDQNYLEQLPTANPIRNKSAVSPKSIFPLFSLPNFKYSNEEIDLAPSFSSKESKEIHNLQQTMLNKLFQNPLFQSNTRFNLKVNNTRFATIRAMYSEAQFHNILPRQQQNEEQVQFESRFQSGNLAFAAKGESQNEYNLLLQKDINTTRCTQWFFFRVKNKKTTGRIKFNIINLLKNYSSYENGMKISFCSESNSFTWTKGGEDIKYLKNNIKMSQSKSYYTLSFIFNFDKQNDTTFFAHSPPYTFTMLDTYLLKFTNSSDYSSIYKRKTLTESPCGNYIEQLTITNFKSKKDKKVLFITARVHPGQTPSSFVCQGIIDFLLSNAQKAKKLRQHFIFKIVPMLNPDGVINGSYRCSLSGYDLNRVWNYDNKISSPEIYFTKKAILEQQKIFLFIDLHAHSKKKGVFMYGCQNKNSPFVSRHIPYLFWKQINHFNYYQCNFGMKIGRQGTSRLCIHRLTGITYSYTMQYSFCSPIKEKFHFTIKHYKQIGQQVCLTLKKYFCAREHYVSEILKQLYENKQLAQVGKDEDQQSSDDSQLDQPTEFKQIIENQRIFRRKGSTFRSKVLEISLDKPIQKSFIRNISPRKTYFPADNVQSLFSRQLSVKVRKQVQIEVPIINIQNHLQKQMKGEEVFLSARLFKRQKQESSQKNINVQPFAMRSTARYEFEDIQGFNNLFLPSLTSASYKRYAKKKNYPNQLTQVGTRYLQSHGLLKQEIRSVSRKKPGPKEQIMSYL